MEQLHREYASVAGCLETIRKACVVDRPHVSTLPLTSRGTGVESKQGAERFEDGSSVLRSGAVKTSMKEKFGHLPIKVNAEK